MTERTERDTERGSDQGAGQGAGRDDGRRAESREDRSRRIRELLTDLSGRVPVSKPDDQVIWEYMNRPSRGPRPALTHDQIAAAAVELADADGLDGVTMRALAGRLDVATMGLYRYVRGKDDVFALMLNWAAREVIPSLTGATGWRDTLRRIATEMRAMHLRHPWMVRLQHSTAAMLAPNALTIMEAGLAALDAADLELDVDQMVSALGAMTAYVQGKAAAEVAQRETYRRHGWSSDDDMRAAAGPQLMGLLIRGDYPTLAHYIVDGSNEDDADWSFVFGLECVLDGIAARLGL